MRLQFAMDTLTTESALDLASLLACAKRPQADG